MVVKSSFVLIKTNKDYELDAYLEAFSVLVAHGIRIDLLGSPNEGHAILAVGDKDENISIEKLIEELEQKRNRYIKKVFKIDAIVKVEELSNLSLLEEKLGLRIKKIVLASGSKKIKKTLMETLRSSKILDYLAREKEASEAVILFPLSFEFVGIKSF